MQTRKDWMKKYYTEEQLTDLRKRWSPEVQAESEHGWAALARDTEAAIARGEDPNGETGQQLARRRQKLLEQFTGLAPSGNSPRSHGATGKASSLSNSFFVFTSGSKAVA